MPRVNTVAKCRKSPGKCGKCGCNIKVGQPYKWFQFAFSPKSIRCSACTISPSDLTRSEYFKQLYGFQARDFSSGTYSTMEELEAAVDELKGELETLRDEQEEKRNNMPESLQESDSGNTLQERYDSLDSAISELDGIDYSFDEPEKEDEESEEDHKNRIAEELNSRIDEVGQEVSDALGNIS